VQGVQVDVLLEIRRLAAEVLEHPRLLFLLREHVGWQETAKSQLIPLGLGECHALVEHRLTQQGHAAW
jgi:hypothetical protein